MPYSEIPLEFANQLAALEKKQLEEGLLQRRLTGLQEVKKLVQSHTQHQNQDLHLMGCQTYLKQVRNY